MRRVVEVGRPRTEYTFDGCFDQFVPIRYFSFRPWPASWARSPSQASPASALPVATACIHDAPDRHVPDGLRVDAELDEHRVDDHLPAGAAERDRLPLELLRRLDRAVRRQAEVEDLTRDHVPDRFDAHAAVDRRRQHAGRRVAHVGLVLGDELRRRESVRDGAGDQLRLDPERLEVAHLERDPQVEVVHHLQRPARRDPPDRLHRRRRPPERLSGGQERAGGEDRGAHRTAPQHLAARQRGLVHTSSFWGD